MLPPGTVYVSISKHQGKPSPAKGAQGKPSVWSINRGNEERCFRNSEHHRWLFDDKGYGLWIVGGIPTVLGFANGRHTKLAKFFSDSNSAPKTWHGFPTQSELEMIPETVADDWRESGYITAPKMRKLIQGLRCDL